MEALWKRRIRVRIFGRRNGQAFKKAFILRKNSLEGKKRNKIECRTSPFSQICHTEQSLILIPPALKREDYEQYTLEDLCLLIKSWEIRLLAPEHRLSRMKHSLEEGRCYFVSPQSSHGIMHSCAFRTKTEYHCQLKGRGAESPTAHRSEGSGTGFERRKEGSERLRCPTEKNLLRKHVRDKLWWLLEIRGKFLRAWKPHWNRCQWQLLFILSIAFLVFVHSLQLYRAGSVTAMGYMQIPSDSTAKAHFYFYGLRIHRWSKFLTSRDLEGCPCNRKGYFTNLLTEHFPSIDSCAK